MKKATVLKSMRTHSGAKDWVKAFSSSYDGELKIVNTETLKSYPELLDYDTPLPMHVVMEQDLSPVVTVIKEGEIGSIVQALVSAGFMEIGSGGPCFTQKWHEVLNKYVSHALEDAFKSVNDYKFEFSGDVSNEFAPVVSAFGTILKALEDANKLANIAEAPENDDFGHDNPEPISISDGEVSSATQKTQAHKDLNQVDEEAISDSQVDSATHETASHVEKSSTDETAPESDSQESVEGKEEPEDISDEAVAEVTKKAVEENLSTEDFLNITFKSLGEARAWENPSEDLFEVVPTSFEDRKKYGRNKTYIVKEKRERRPLGKFR